MLFDHALDGLFKFTVVELVELQWSSMAKDAMSKALVCIKSVPRVHSQSCQHDSNESVPGQRTFSMLYRSWRVAYPPVLVPTM